MKLGFGYKIFLSIALLFLFVIFGFIGSAFTLLVWGQPFLNILLIILLVAIYIFFILGIFKLIKPKPLKIAIISFFSVFLVVFISFQIKEAHEANLATVNDQGVNLYEYQPFKEDTKSVSLEESSFSITDNIPILDGATALYPVYAAFAQATYPERDYDVYHSEIISSTTPEAYKRLMNGDADIIFAAGPSQRQLQEAERAGVELELTPIGREAFVFFVNERNPVDSLSIEQIQKIYSGEITNWSEVGGNNETIRPFQRPNDSGSQTALENLMGDIPLMTPPTEDIVSGMGGIISQTSSYRNHRNALGYSFRYFSTEMVQEGEIKHLAVDEVYPDKEAIRSDKYPIAAEFYAITAGSDNPNIAEFIEWILSEQGQRIIEKTGYVPVKEF
ncbi:substrate-binding domain-containing protein [Evansella sp. AB-P1]|uniref:PstS family phosphate ABC transporter substrate-binding protein n=1 Tax=Evansella sp. AB-P1 TaxID=3037653 RepID=UPI00241DF267|nr:substrate-binding domain-containing protein [Evansella sp. AB-P1]MDG5786133.1 substrate-binding domain-containing protein [Evansella sp. AB-P1]